jgi:hypothetical protein
VPLATASYPGGTVRVPFPIDPVAFFIEEPVFALKTLNAEEYLDEGPFAATNRRWPYEDRT